MSDRELAEIMFPEITKTIKDYEELYPERELSEGARVTRFAPSPTGFVHIGNYFQTIISYLNARNTNGIFYLRNEDTDQKREIKNAANLIMETLIHYNMIPDEYEIDGKIIGNYGPYIQSERKNIYHTFVKYFVEIGRAYPCFCSEEDLSHLREVQEKSKKRIGYYGKYAKCRFLTNEERAELIKKGVPYVVRFKSNGDFNKKVKFNDLVKGEIEFPQNDIDHVILKSSDKLPTYHFAHLVDDYLMHTTHVTRGEEWLSSVPLHIELFETLGVKQPLYIHNPLLLKKDGDNYRKISKRKDPEASMSFFKEKGYPIYAVIDSLMTIINSNYEEWRDKNPDALFTEFIFDPKKMSSSGALYPLEKLDNISKNYLSRLKASEVYNNLLVWSNEYDKDFYTILNNNKEYSISILNIEREILKPRKDFSCYSEIKNCIWYMFDELYKPTNYEWGNVKELDEIKFVLNTYINKYFDISNKEDWFNKVKALCDELGYASNMKEYKLNPDNYKGNVADISTILRVALTSKSMTPDLFEIMKLLGKERIIDRIKSI